MATLTQIPPTNPANQIPPSEATASPAEKSSCPPPTNQIVPSAQPSKPRKFVMHRDDSDDSDQDLELDGGPLAHLELTSLKSVLKEEIKFKLADPSTMINPDEDMMRELEKKGRLIRLGYEESASTEPLPPSQPKPPPKPLTPLYNPSNLCMTWKQPRKIGSGLYNLGNTCFLNSVVQCLTYTPPLANYFFSREHSNICKVNGFCAMCVLQRHYYQCQSQTTFFPVRPTIVNYLHKIAPCFHPGRQEDAHEFLRYLVDAMQNSCLASSLPKQSQELQCTTVVHQIFGGQVMSQVTCLSCKTKSDTFEPILDLSLHIKGCGTIQEAMRRATQPDKLEGSNSYFCDKCKKKCPAQKLVSIFTPPRVLTIHLKRFSFGSQLGVKLQGKIKFTPLLDIRPYMENKQAAKVEYRLYAVLVHSGFTCNSGHYYCYVVGPNGSWHKMNDSYVTPVGEQVVLESEAYMLFYRQMIKPPQQKSQTKLVIAGLGANQPSPLSSKQTPPHKSPTTPNCKQTNISNQPTALQSKDASNIFSCLSKNNHSELSQKLFKRDENSFETPKKAKDNLPNPVTPFSVSSNNSPTSEENTPRTERNKDVNNNKNDINNTTTPSNNSSDSINSIKDPIDSDKENSHDSINSYKAGTSKPVAVVTPKQTDTKKTTSHFSSTAVHKENAFKTPTQTVRTFYKNTSIVVRKKIPVSSPGLDTVALEDRVKQAQKKHRILQRSNLQDEMDVVALPSKKPKLETATSHTPAVNKVAPIVSELKKEKENVPIKSADSVSEVKIKSKPDPLIQAEKPQVTKAFSITGVQGVKPTAVVPPANVEAMNTESADRKIGQIEVDQSHLTEVDQSNEEIQEIEISSKATKSEKGNRKERHKEKYLKKISSSHSKKESDKLSKRAIKKEYFKSIEDLKSELLEFTKTSKVKVEKKLKKSRDKHKNNNSDETLSSPDQSRHSNKKSHRSTYLTSPVASHRHSHRSSGHSDTTPHKDRPHKSDRIVSRTRQEESDRDSTGGVKVSKSHSFQSLGGDLKPWEGETSALGWMECDRLNKNSHEIDPDLDRGKLPKKKKQKTRHGKPNNQKFQAAYERRTH